MAWLLDWQAAEGSQSAQLLAACIGALLARRMASLVCPPGTRRGPAAVTVTRPSLCLCLRPCQVGRRRSRTEFGEDEDLEEEWISDVSWEVVGWLTLFWLALFQLPCLQESLSDRGWGGVDRRCELGAVGWALFRLPSQ